MLTTFRVFVSSTAVDLVEHRAKVREAIVTLSALPVAMETFGAKSDAPVDVCCRLASEADAVVVIVAHRYGWIPSQEVGGDGEKSITWLEVDAALAAGRPVFVFLVDPSYAEWTSAKEQDRLVDASDEDVPKIVGAVQGLKRFKTFLQARTRDVFTTPDNLQARVALSLSPWLAEQVAKRAPQDGVATPAAARPNRSWKPKVVHALQPALHFAGRAEQVALLRSWWEGSAQSTRVLSLQAAGGTGKTALAEQLLKYIGDGPARAGVFVWSFYEDPKTEAFLRSACGYFCEDVDKASGGWLERLQVALADGRPHLLVMDGLERVQSEGGGGRVRGELDEHSLKLLLRSLARGAYGARVLVTTRFELVDLNPWLNQGYHRERLDDLDAAAACAVLRAWNVLGDDATLGRLADNVGRHALSVSVLGSYLGTYWNGDPSRAPEFSLEDAAPIDRTAHRLARVLHEYSKKLTDRERDLLARLATFSRGVDIGLLLALASAGDAVAGALHRCSESQLKLSLGALRQQGLVFAYQEKGEPKYSAHPFLREYFQGILSVPANQVHEAIRASLAPTLEAAPRKLPTDAIAIDNYDTLIEHTRLAGRLPEALLLYRSALGDYGHLGLVVGDYDRGLRIHAAFMGDPKFDSQLGAVQKSFVIYERGLFSSDSGDLELARQCLADAARRDKELENVGYRCVDLRHLACVLWKQGRLSEARSAATDSVELARSHGSADRLSMSLYHLAYVEGLLGQAELSRGHFEAALKPQGMQSIETGFAHARCGYLALEARVRTGDGSLRVSEFDEIIGNAESRRLLREVPRYRLLRGLLAARHDDLKVARSALDDVRSWTDRTHDVEVAIRAYGLAAEIATKEQRLDAALAEAHNGIALAESCGHEIALVDLLNTLAAGHLASSEPAKAFEYAQRAFRRAERDGCDYMWGKADSLHWGGLAKAHLGESGEARARLEQAIELRAALGDPRVSQTRAIVSAL
jgi:tetratricopeptide (TPR) repeat protein